MNFPIKGRYIVIFWLFPIIYLPGQQTLYELIDSQSPWYWFNIVNYYYYHYLAMLLLIILTLVYKINWRTMFNKPTINWQPALLVTSFILIFSMAGVYLLYYPLSFVAPDFVANYFHNTEPFIYFSPVDFPVLPNVLSFMSLVIFAPIIEELMFRGLLLHRWSQKWNKATAVLLSALIFALLHSEPIGAFAFAVAMSFLYLKYQTLLVPIVCHAFHNTLVWIITLANLWDENTIDSPLGIVTLREFQSDIWIGMICGVICCLWVTWYVKSENLKGNDIKNLDTIKQKWQSYQLPKVTKD